MIWLHGKQECVASFDAGKLSLLCRERGGITDWDLRSEG